MEEQQDDRSQTNIEQQKTVITPRRKQCASEVKSRLVHADDTVIAPRSKMGFRAQGDAFASASEDTLIVPRTARDDTANILQPGPGVPPRLAGGELLIAASELLALVAQLRYVNVGLQVSSLHRIVVAGLQQFHQRALTICDQSQTRRDYSYVLCALIDETVLNTAWGEHSGWSQRTMLSLYHRETYGGEKVYRILAQALANSRRHQDLLELIYLALSLGFMGKLRIDPKGDAKVDSLRERIFLLLPSRVSDTANGGGFSPTIKPVSGGFNPLHSLLPYWLLMAVLLLSALLLYGHWRWQLNEKSEQTLALISTLMPESLQQPSQVEGASTAVTSLQELLADEVARGVLAIHAAGGHAAITLPNQGAFASASAELNSAVEPVLDKIARALETVPGRITVVGHTDDQPIDTSVYPSNWHLSLARASSVVNYLDAAASLQSRLLPEGRGADQPIADNAHPAGRARNRRVVIEIQPQLTSAFERERQ